MECIFADYVTTSQGIGWNTEERSVAEEMYSPRSCRRAQLATPPMIMLDARAWAGDHLGAMRLLGARALKGKGKGM